ncbi:hypothetical protein MS2017_1061 [Bathymodiolus thermophilus thioautotrophic gill symbiont]|uniref:Metalloprotease StcE beta-sandwich domain-containing protein n=2 Tax=Bathymodiolus thermophilus thioautotrophic gill symbiont TaxID=2360 RepID=A0A1J5U907_9GAMM|nr:hypothetical protein MS2017_1061 [Bathymodiolus thermophilus thioautotrophic gill symbiont]OIR24865.1 hypothetical protein BGC33_04755 [Bathymodiolus thermophilus thioautotrophic gill symbiont]CAB5496085.1 hypothetical protein THERMOS_427 [Bathymodiolus thermophilus thioautotrophic gill symbiont]
MFGASFVCALDIQIKGEAMDKKILLFCVSFFCLSSVNALELPKNTHVIGERSLDLWFWKLDSSIDDQDDIENNVLKTISSVGTDVHVHAHWLGSDYENYQDFKNVIHKVSNSRNQVDEFASYIRSNYTDRVNNYHILMAEGEWGDSLGEALELVSRFAVVSDDMDYTAAHEMGHMLGAVHNQDTNWFSASIMYSSSIWLYGRQNKFWSSANKNIVKKTLEELKRFLYDKSISTRYSHFDGSTTNAKEYKGLSSDKGNKAIIYKLLVEKNTTYTIAITDANFDTYLYVYDKNGRQLDKNNDSNHFLIQCGWRCFLLPSDDNAFLRSRIDNQNFGSAKEVYIVVSGNKHDDHGNFSLNLSSYKTFIIEDNSTLRSLKNNAPKLKEYIDSNNKVWLKTRNGAWTENIVLPQGVNESKKVTLTVDSDWPVKVIFTINNVRKTRTVLRGQEISCVYTKDGWLVK